MRKKSEPRPSGSNVSCERGLRGKAPRTPNSIWGALVVVALIAKIEVLVPCVVLSSLGRTPVQSIVETTDVGIIIIKAVQLVFGWQKPTRSITPCGCISLTKSCCIVRVK